MSSQALLRRLKPLGYDFTNEKVNFEDDKQFHQVIQWLFESHFNAKNKDLVLNLKVQEPQWSINASKMLEMLNCPYKLTDKLEIINFCTSLALRQKLFENCNSQNKEENSMEIEASNSQENSFDNINFEDEKIKTEVEELAKLMRISIHPNPAITLKAINIHLQKVIDNAEIQKKETNIDIDGISLGLDTGNSQLNRAAKVLRMLFVGDLRQLQSGINRLLVQVQAVTAHPKTDTSLGKVGF